MNNNPTLLSILIPTIPERRESLNGLLEVLYAQMRPRVEIIINCDQKDVTLGGKENRLLQSAQGKYVVFMDDDDMIRPYYLDKVFEGIENDVDVVQIKTDYYIEGVWQALITFHIGETWRVGDEKHYIRSSAKFCPHRRELALQVMFEDINLTEDQRYSRELDKLCKTEHQVDVPIYEYRFNPRKTQ